MSSLLKALKQQQSPLVNRGSDLDPSLVDAPEQGGRATVWLVALGLVIIMLLAFIGWQLLAADDKDNKQPSQSNSALSDYQLGESYEVSSVSWPAQQPEESPRVDAEPIVVRPEPESRNNQREPLDLNQVSPELLAKFEQAVQQSSAGNANQDDNRSSVVPPLAELSDSFKQQVAPFSYDGHMYLSDPEQRWVELNQQRYYVGERFNGLRIEQIEPQRLVLSRDGQAFSIDALSDWNGLNE